MMICSKEKRGHFEEEKSSFLRGRNLPRGLMVPFEKVMTVITCNTAKTYAEKTMLPIPLVPKYQNTIVL